MRAYESTPIKAKTVPLAKNVVTTKKKDRQSLIL